MTFRWSSAGRFFSFFVVPTCPTMHWTSSVAGSSSFRCSHPPLLALSALRGYPGGSVAVPFLADVEVNVRFLIALPLLIISELVVHQRMRLIIRQFLERNLIPESALPRFEAVIASAFRLRNSLLAELSLIGLYIFSGCFFSGAITWRCRLYVVRNSGRGWDAVHTCRNLVRLYQLADLSVFARPLVLPDFDLDALSLAGGAH